MGLMDAHGLDALPSLVERVALGQVAPALHAVERTSPRVVPGPVRGADVVTNAALHHDGGPG